VAHSIDVSGERLMSQPESPWRRWTPRLVIAAVLLALLAIFIAQNYVTVEVRILFWSTEMRLAWTLLLATLIGIVVGWLLPRRRR
jgi:uncharacterized integral membrane protein